MSKKYYWINFVLYRTCAMQAVVSEGWSEFVNRNMLLSVDNKYHFSLKNFKKISYLDYWRMRPFNPESLADMADGLSPLQEEDWPHHYPIQERYNVIAENDNGQPIALWQGNIAELRVAKIAAGTASKHYAHVMIYNHKGEAVFPEKK